MRLSISIFLTINVFIIALAYHFSIFYNFSFEDGFRWIKNNPGCTLFVLIFLPIAIGVFTFSFPLDIYDNFTTGKIIISTIFIPLGIFLSSKTVIEDITTSSNRIILPYHLRNSSNILELEKQLRLDVENKEISSEDARNEYQSQVGNFSNIKELFERGSIAIILELIINFIAAYFCVIYFILGCLFTIGRDFTKLTDTERFSLNGIVVVYFILVFWLILRLYSEWYINFYSFQFVIDYSAYIFLAFLAIIFFLIGILFFNQDLTLKIGSILSFIAIVILPVLSQFQPKTVESILRVFKKIVNRLSINNYILFNITNFFAVIIISLLIFFS